MDGIDEDGYLTPQPSVEYIESRQAQSAQSNPVPTYAEPTPDYCYVSPPTMAKLPDAVTPGHEADYQSLQPNNGIASSHLYQPLT